jgi:hypothetical protein
VKQSSILAVASVLSIAYPLLGADAVTRSLSLFGERLTSELTRESTLRALTMMALNHQKKSDKEMPLIPLKNLDQYLKTFFDLLKNSEEAAS